MVGKKPATKSTKTSAKRTSTSGRFTAEERAAMKARAQELKAEERASKNRAEGEREVLAAIDAMRDRIAPWPSGSTRSSQRTRRPLAEDLVRDARICQGGQGRLLLQERGKFDSRYATFGFEEAANLDEGAMWPTSFALKKLTPPTRRRSVRS